METASAAELREQIRSVDAAIEQSLGVKGYSFGTGQSTQSVQRQSLSELRKYRAHLVARLGALENGHVEYLNT